MRQLHQLTELSRKVDQTTCETKADTKTLLLLTALLEQPNLKNMDLAEKLASTLAVISDSLVRQEASIKGLEERLTQMQQNFSERQDALERQINRLSDQLDQLFEPEDGDNS
jgi:hypothetical protein